MTYYYATTAFSHLPGSQMTFESTNHHHHQQQQQQHVCLLLELPICIDVYKVIVCLVLHCVDPRLHYVDNTRCPSLFPTSFGIPTPYRDGNFF